MALTFELWTYAGAAEGEILNAHNRTVKLGLNAPSTCSFQVALDHNFATLILAENYLISVKRNGTLIFLGPIVSAEEIATGDGGKIAVVAIDPFFDRLPWRLIGKQVDSTNKGVGYSHGTALAPVVRGQIAKNIIDVTNAADGFTGVETNNSWITDTATGYVGPWYFKPVAEAVVELANTLDGYDFEIRPVTPVTIAAGLKLAEFRTYAARGTTRANTVFEYGTGKRNMSGYRRPKVRESQITKAWSLPQGFPDAAMAIVNPDENGNGGVYQAPIANNYDPGAALVTWGLREAVVAGDLTVDALRQQLCNEHVRIRRNPREQIIFDLSTNIEYNFGVDYDIGDIVTARAKINGVVRFEALFRVYGVEIGVSDVGEESVSLTVIPS